MTDIERIDEILNSINNGEIFGSLPVLFALDNDKVIEKMLAYKLIFSKNNKYQLTKDGYDAIELGGFKYWQNKSLRMEQENNAKSGQNIHILAPITNSQIGSHGSVVENLTKTQPNQKAIGNDDKHKNYMSISIAQFIFWLFTAFGVGITIGYNVFNTLKK